jgi:ABC-type glycerol-3-phosphate transport system substrate-binding protein
VVHDHVKRSRRFVLKTLGAAVTTTLLAACSSASPAPKPAADAAKPAPPAAPPAAPGAAPAAPAASPVVGAGIGGAQPAVAASPAAAAAAGALQNPVPFQGPAVKASGPTTLTFWQYVPFHVDTQKLIAEEFKKRGDPNVSLEITAYPTLNDQRTAVKAALAAASPTPDIIAIEPGAYCVDVYTNKSVIGFNKVFEADPEYKKGFWPNALSLLTINGETVSVPAVTNTVSVYYNKKLFAENNVQPPATLDDLKKLGPVFNGKGIAPIAYPAGQDRNYPIFPFYAMAGRLKADTLLREADLGQKPWTSAQLVEAASVVEDLAKSDLYAKGPLGIKEPDGIALFASGKAAMFWAGQWMRTSIRKAIDPSFDLGIFPFPALTAGGPNPTLSSVGITLTVNAKSKYPELAFEMIKALTGAWGKVEYSRGLGISPNGPISGEALAYQMEALKDPLYPEFLKLQPTGTTRVIFTPQVEEALYQGMQAILTGQKPAKQVMEEVESASQKAGERKFTVG